MNRSKLIPEYSKRYYQMKKITRIAAYSAVLLVTLIFLGYGIVSGMPPVVSVLETDADPSVTDGVFVPEPIPEHLFDDGENEDVFAEFFYENDEPIAMGIYDDIFAEEKVTVPEGELKIVKTDLSKSPAPGTVLLKNNTSYKIKSKDYLSADKLTLPSSAGISDTAPDMDNPLVFIYHSHGTEAYAEEGKTSYLKKKLPRSTDITKNVVAVGGVIADILNENGIPTVHCEIMHDKDSYNKAYTYSKATLREYLEKYPSIKYCFDIHRDALLNSTTVYKVLTYDGSAPVAQVMFVVGTDANGSDHPNWRNNLALAVDAQFLLSMRLENLMRPICIRSCTFWQEYCEGGLLLEVGTCVNTLAEAKAAAKIVGQTLTTLIRARENL